MVDAACAKCRLIESIELAAEQASIEGLSVLAVIAALESSLTRWQPRFIQLAKQEG